MSVIWAEHALTPEGWARDVRLEIDAEGRIAALTTGAAPEGQRVGTLLPAPANSHSHAFQRAMAGLSERRGPDPRDSFWTWRKLMYKFLDQITPDQVEAHRGAGADGDARGGIRHQYRVPLPASPARWAAL